ncbi:hypothetical protein [Streptomyces sp. NPDC048248]|uniref:hypothetical protein n=1 Tax=Streptomyces sp. NPDC048248 TaxID=3365523 RepID=UPI0037167BB3
MVEGGPLGGLQFDGTEEVGDLAGHGEGDRQLRDRDVLLGGGVLGHEVGDGGADRAAADAVLPGEGGDGAAFQVRGAYVGGLRGRHGGRRPPLLPLASAARSPS